MFQSDVPVILLNGNGQFCHENLDGCLLRMSSL